jgi:peptidase M50-like protein
MSAPAELATTRSKTPYLDREIPLPPSTRGRAKLKWWQIVLFAMGLFVDIFRVVFLLWMFSILIHELGHLFAGFLVGERFNYIRVGPIQVNRPWRISWNWTRHAFLTGGTTTLPVTRSGLRWKLFFSTLAGPTANIAASVLAFEVMPHYGSKYEALSMLFVLVSGFIGVVNLFSTEVDDGVMPDGARMWVLLFDKRRRERLISILVLFADVKQGKKIESLDAYAADEGLQVRDGTAQQVIANWVAFMRTNREESGSQYLENCLAASAVVAPSFRNLLILEAARFQVTQRKNCALAREWLALADSATLSFPRFFAEALILQHENQVQQAMAVVEDALKYVEGANTERSRDVHLRVLNELKTSLQAAETAELGLS